MCRVLTGMYSDAEDGERSDYLTFEEGFASLCEIAMDSGFSKWKPMHVSHYFALSAAYGGSDFRETYESLWRARVLMDAPDGKDVTDRTIDLAKSRLGCRVCVYFVVRRLSLRMVRY